MTVGEHLKELKAAPNYAAVRINLSDQFIEMVEMMMPRDWDEIKEKELEFREWRSEFNEFFN